MGSAVASMLALPAADVVAGSGGDGSDCGLNAGLRTEGVFSASLSLKRLSVLKERETKSSNVLGSSREAN